jgi:hypothetical protein
MPEGERNGLGALAHDLVDNPDRVHVAIVLLDAVKLTTTVDSGDVVPTVRIRAIEPITAHETDAAELHRLMRRAYERRTGQTELPLELEREMESLALDDAADTTDEGDGDRS